MDDRPRSGRQRGAEVLGPANPALPPLHFPEGTAYGWEWDRGLYLVESGWFHDRFLQLFCEGLEPLLRCVRAWDFLTGPEPISRMVVGRNAYGSIFVLDDVTDPGNDRLKLLDPLSVSFWQDRNLNFGSFVSRAIPNGELGILFDDTVYRAWRGRSGRYLEPDQMLAPIVPLTLGGAFVPDNFRIENVFEYYEATGDIYRRTLRR